MMLLAMLLAAQPALMEKADEANLAFTSCLFAQSREAHAARLPLAEFKRKLANACLAEERQLQSAATRVMAKRGEPNPAVAAKKLTSEARASVIATYESLPRIERQLEKLGEICRQQPEACS